MTDETKKTPADDNANDSADQADPSTDQDETPVERDLQADSAEAAVPAEDVTNDDGPEEVEAELVDDAHGDGKSTIEAAAAQGDTIELGAEDLSGDATSEDLSNKDDTDPTAPIGVEPGATAPAGMTPSLTLAAAVGIVVVLGFAFWGLSSSGDKSAQSERAPQPSGAQSAEQDVFEGLGANEAPAGSKVKNPVDLSEVDARVAASEAHAAEFAKTGGETVADMVAGLDKSKIVNKNVLENSDALAAGAEAHAAGQELGAEGAVEEWVEGEWRPEGAAEEAAAENASDNASDDPHEEEWVDGAWQAAAVDASGAADDVASAADAAVAEADTALNETPAKDVAEGVANQETAAAVEVADTADAAVEETLAQDPAGEEIAAVDETVETAPDETGPAQEQGAEAAPLVSDAQKLALAASEEMLAQADGEDGPSRDVLLSQLEAMRDALALAHDSLSRQEDQIAQLRNETREAFETRQENAREETRALRLALERFQQETRILAAESPDMNAEDHVSAAAILAITSLRQKIERGLPAKDELDILSRLAPQNPQIASLQEALAGGVPTLQSVQEGFSRAAAKALAAAGDAEADNVAEKFAARVKSLVSVRPAEPIEGDTPVAIISRVEAYVAQNDLKAALSEVAALSEPVQSAMDEWLAQAKTLNSVNAAVEALGAQFIEDAAE